MVDFRRFSFKAEWYQAEAKIMREFILNFYPADNQVEIYDQRTQKAFLRRTKVDGLNENNFYVGAKVNVLGRNIRLLDYADGMTHNTLASKREKTLCVIKSPAMRELAVILKILKEQEFILSDCVMVEVDANTCSELAANGNAGETVEPGVVLALELIGCNAVGRLRQLIESSDSQGENEPPRHGIDLFRKGVYGSVSVVNVSKEVEMFFGKPTIRPHPKLVATYDSTTLAIIKPHAFLSGHFFDIVADICTGGFIITAMRMYELCRGNSEEFLEVYKGVVDEYLQMAIELAKGKCIALEVGADNPNVNVYKEFRQLCGPADPVVARQLYPKSIRGKYGVNKVQNAIHCTDLEEDCKLEVEYFFKILPY